MKRRNLRLKYEKRQSIWILNIDEKGERNELFARNRNLSNGQMTQYSYWFRLTMDAIIIIQIQKAVPMIQKANIACHC